MATTTGQFDQGRVTARLLFVLAETGVGAGEAVANDLFFNLGAIRPNFVWIISPVSPRPRRANSRAVYLGRGVKGGGGAPPPDRTRPATIVVAPPPRQRFADRRQPIIRNPRRLGDVDARLAPAARVVVGPPPRQRWAHRTPIRLPLGALTAVGVADARTDPATVVLPRQPIRRRAHRTPIYRPGATQLAVGVADERVYAARVVLPVQPVKQRAIRVPPHLPATEAAVGLADERVRRVAIVRPVDDRVRRADRRQSILVVGGRREAPPPLSDRTWRATIVRGPDPLARHARRVPARIGAPRRVGDTDARLTEGLLAIAPSPRRRLADRRQPRIIGGVVAAVGVGDERTRPARLVLPVQPLRQRAHRTPVRLPLGALAAVGQADPLVQAATLIRALDSRPRVTARGSVRLPEVARDVAGVTRGPAVVSARRDRRPIRQPWTGRAVKETPVAPGTDRVGPRAIVAVPRFDRRSIRPGVVWQGWPAKQPAGDLTAVLWVAPVLTATLRHGHALTATLAAAPVLTAELRSGRALDATLRIERALDAALRFG